MKKRILTIFAILVTLCIFVLLLPPNRYIVRALWYGSPRLDDYKHFVNREIQANQPMLWNIAEDYNLKRLSKEQLNYFDSLGTVSYLIIKDTSIVFEQYWEDYNQHSLSNSFSAAKSIVALLAGIARDEGRIKDFNQSVGDYFQPFANDDRKSITIKDLLTMSAGVEWDEAYSSLFSITTEAYYGIDLFNMISKLRLIEQPGNYFRYQSGVTQLLAFVIEKAVGKSISEYASEKLWTPIGSENIALWSLDHKNGVEKAYCCFNTNARDFARIGQLVLNKGKWNGKQVISEDFIVEATSPALWLKDGKTGKTVDFYGYQWWILNHKGYEVKYARGILGQYIFAIPEKNMVVVRLGHKHSSTRTVDNNPDDIIVWLDTAFDIVN